MQIQISWLLQKPTDLNLHCFQGQAISGFSRTRVKSNVRCKSIDSRQQLDIKWRKCDIFAVAGHSCGQTFQQQREKTCPLTCVSNEDLYQPAYPRRSDQILCCPHEETCILGYKICTQWRFLLDDVNTRLIWIVNGCTCPKVRLLSCYVRSYSVCPDRISRPNSMDVWK